MAAESELRMHALADHDRCWGYFPSLAGAAGVITALPACAAFAARLPHIAHAGLVYRFSFLRLSLVQQGADASYHLDSDADTAITGEVASLARRLILRLLLNLSTQNDRTLHYLDVDPWSVRLAADGSYVRLASRAPLSRHARTVTIPRRCGSTVHGLAFASNLVLHSGVDDLSGHRVAAYGIETGGAAGSGFTTLEPTNAESTRSRSSRCSITPASRSPKTR
jgi:hypothetical protein